MQLLFKLLVLSVICVTGVGFYLGWFSLSKPSPDADGNKTNISVSVDKGKMKSDIKKAKETIKEDIREIEGKGKAKETKPAPQQ